MEELYINWYSPATALEFGVTENSKIALEFSKILIENILEYSRLERGNESVCKTNVHWVDFITESLVIPQIIAQESEIEVLSEVEDPHLKSQIDSTIVRRIIQNLVVNAIKYCPPKSKVQIQVCRSKEPTSEGIEVNVVDNGPGLAGEALLHIFEEGHQFDLRSNLSFKGIGMGLTFAYEAAILCGGSLSVEPNLPRGLCFKLRLPL